MCNFWNNYQKQKWPKGLENGMWLYKQLYQTVYFIQKI